jgi:hypothetical protein
MMRAVDSPLLPLPPLLLLLLEEELVPLLLAPPLLPWTSWSTEALLPESRHSTSSVVSIKHDLDCVGYCEHSRAFHIKGGKPLQAPSQRPLFRQAANSPHKAQTMQRVMTPSELPSPASSGCVTHTPGRVCHQPAATHLLQTGS